MSAASAATLAGCATPSANARREPAPAQAVSDNYGRIHLPAGARILVLGDDYVGPPEALPGAKLKSKGRKVGEPYTVELAKVLGSRATVIPQTRPGARIEQALAEFDSYPKADAIVMLFGPGDAWGGAAPLPAQRFSSALRQLLQKAQAAGAALVLVAPPPVSVPNLDTGPITAYRNVVGVQGGEVQASVVEFGPQFRTVSHLWTDGIHLDTAGSRAVARRVADQFVPGG